MVLGLLKLLTFKLLYGIHHRWLMRVPGTISSPLPGAPLGRSDSSRRARDDPRNMQSVRGPWPDRTPPTHTDSETVPETTNHTNDVYNCRQERQKHLVKISGILYEFRSDSVKLDYCNSVPDVKDQAPTERSW